MSQWRPLGNKDAYYFLVDSKPDEVVDDLNPDTVFSTVFVDTPSCFNGVRVADFPWLKQYKESGSLDESKDIVKRLATEIFENNNFKDLHVIVMSSSFEAIGRNGMAFLQGAEKEIDNFSIEDDHVSFSGEKYSLNKAKMLMWYNFCLCNLAPRLVDRTLIYKKTNAIFAIDRLGDQDDRIMKFMEVITKQSSLRALCNRCAEDHKEKPAWVGYEFMSELDKDGHIVPTRNCMQDSLVDWMTQAAYANSNGVGTSDPEYYELLMTLFKRMFDNKQITPILFRGNMTWGSADH